MKSLGDRGEKLAAGFLKKSGLKILKRNYTSPTGEIDIIARDGDTVVFVEVKTRTDDQFGPPEQAVGGRKQQKIRTAALHYLQGLKEQPAARFDIVSIYVRGDKEEVEHIKDAFEA